MSAFIREEIFEWLIGSVELSNNIFFNWAFTSILSTVLYFITFRMVRKLYHSDLISGSTAGKVYYFILFLINVIVTALILRIIKWIRWIFNYIISFPVWVYLIIVVGISFCIVLMLLNKSQFKSVKKIFKFNNKMKDL